MSVQIVNSNLMKHPLNWFVVWSMVLVAGFTLHLIVSWWQGRHPGIATGGPVVSAGPGTSTDTTNPNAVAGS